MEYKDRLEFALDATKTGIWTHDGRNDLVELDGRMQAVWG